MPSFKTEQESLADHKGAKYQIPDRLMRAYFVTKGISWRDYQEMPSSLREEIIFLWHVQGIADKAENRGK